MSKQINNKAATHITIIGEHIEITNVINNNKKTAIITTTGAAIIAIKNNNISFKYFILYSLQ